MTLSLLITGFPVVWQGCRGTIFLLFVILLLEMNIGQPQAGECVINHIEEFLFLDEQSALNAAGFGSVLLA